MTLEHQAEPGNDPSRDDEPGDTITVSDVPEESRFVIADGDGEIGEITYRRDGSTLVIDHTGIAPAFEGRGLAARLTSAAMATIIERGEHVVPLCSYTVAYLRRHPEIAAQVLAEA